MMFCEDRFEFPSSLISHDIKVYNVIHFTFVLACMLEIYVFATVFSAVDQSQLAFAIENVVAKASVGNAET